MNLVRYEAARTALAECRAVDEVKDIRDKAVAMQAYARQAKDTELMQHAAEIKVRAERKLGEMLREQRETVGFATGGQPYQSTGSATELVAPTLAQVGIDKKLSMRSQQLAAMPDAQFEATIATARETASAVSTTMMLRVSQEAQANDALRAEIEAMKRDNAWKRARTALDDPIYWMQIAIENQSECAPEVAREIAAKVETIARLARTIEGVTTC